MFLILMQLLKNKDEKKFEEFVKNLSEDEIINLLIEAEEYINYFNVNFNNKCEKNDECCLFAILESKISKMLNITEEAKFKLLQKKLKAEFENNIELQKELQEFFDNLRINFKEEPTQNIDNGIGR